MNEIEYQSGRFWTYSKDEWTPPWWNKLGIPYRGEDEWGRRTLVVGFWFLGYVVWAWRTCWSCKDCHELREQTYHILRENEIRAQVAKEIITEAKRMQVVLSMPGLDPAEASSMIEELEGLWKAIRIADQETYEEAGRYEGPLENAKE